MHPLYPAQLLGLGSKEIIMDVEPRLSEKNDHHIIIYKTGKVEQPKNEN